NSRSSGAAAAMEVQESATAIADQRATLEGEPCIGTLAGSEHDGRVEPSLQSGARAHHEASARSIDHPSLVGVGQAAEVTGITLARPRLAGAAVDVGVARLIEGDHVRLNDAVARAEIEFDELAGLKGKLRAQQVVAVLLHVREAGHVHLL